MEEFLLAAVAGLVTGLLAALFGVGGGIIMVAYLVLVLDRGQHLAEGTSLLVIIVTAIVGTYGHAKRGYVSFDRATYIGLGGIVGGVVGALLALQIPGETLKKGFAVILLYSGVRLIVKALRSPKEEPAPQP
jgi:uncharacterized protein